MHYLLKNQLSDGRAQRSLQVMVLDAQGHYTRAGAEVRLYASRSGRLLAANILDTGSGYNSQNAMPVHFGLSNEETVDVEVTTMTKQGRRTALLPKVDPKTYAGRWLIVKVNADGQIIK